MAIKDYSTEPDMNTTISGINIAEGCAPSGINNAIRQLMADMKAEKVERDAAQDERDAAQDEAIRAAQTSANNAQSTANAANSEAQAALSEAVIGQEMAEEAKRGLVGVVRSVNGASANAAGAVSTMPDYSAGVEFTISINGYTAPSDGYIMGDFNASGDTTAYLYINGKNVGHDCNEGQAICFPVSKGNLIRVTTGTFSHKNYFYPIKGA